MTGPSPVEGTSRALRVRIVKRFVSGLGIAEATLLDVPLDPAVWTKDEQRDFDALERKVTR